MNLFCPHCRVCGGRGFKTVPATGWVEKFLLPRLFIVPGRCTACEKRRYCPSFQHWDTSNEWR